MTRLEQIGPEHSDQAYGFCASHPVACTYIAGWIHEGGLTQSGAAAKGWLLAEQSAGGQIVGLVYLSATGILMPVLRSERCLEQLVALARMNPGMIRVIVGSRRLVQALWREFAGIGMTARLARNQRVYAVERADFVPRETLGVRPAATLDADDVIEASAAMAREEAGDDPQSRNPKLFAERIRARMGRQRDFIFRTRGVLSFKSNVSAISPIGGLLEGVYTAPGQRQQGIGVRGTSDVTAWILERAARTVLLVNDDNHVALTMYESLGYSVRADSRTIFVAP